jgi:SAM-dependent methyltransferase
MRWPILLSKPVSIPRTDEGFGRELASNLVEAGNRRAKEQRLANLRFEQGDAADLAGLPDEGSDLLVSVFGAIFAPKPFEVAKEMVRVTRPGGRIVMGNWIPNDPTLVAQVLSIIATYMPPPPEGFVSPMTWGIKDDVIERFANAGVAPANVSFARDTFTFHFAGSPSEFVEAFKSYYGPTMNAFEAAERSGRAGAMRRQLAALFEGQNINSGKNATSIPATFLRVTVER